MIRFSDILDQIHTYLPKAETTLVEKAYVYSAKVHQGQTRLSGEPYLSHPLAVAYTLAKMRLDLPTIAAGLLHDTVEDTCASLEEIGRLFGEEVAGIVDGVTKISAMPLASKLEKQAENLRKMLLAMAKDIRVILVKLADRLHNMRTLEYQKEGKRAQISRETLDIYAPLAARLGIDWMKRELEDLSFCHLYPDEYRQLRDAVEQMITERQSFVEEVKEILEHTLALHGLKGRILGRRKHLYSIWRKLERQGLTIDQLDQIYDIIGFRIILKEVKECYEALGVVHSLWKPIPGRFKDYISLPKPNMYQSLHTTVIGPYGERMEIQIRTEEMDRIANEGIASHWLYKEGKILSGKSGQFEWLKRLVELQKELQNPKEFLESVRLDLFPDEVYVFTPKGEVKVFPQGATPIDFAYAIHTEVGHHCIGAKVNGQIVSLRYKLQTGDMVEILTSAQARPSRDWLKYVKTSRARARIRHFLKKEEEARSLALGRELCEREFRKHRLDFSQFADSPEAENIAREFSFKSFQDLIIGVGFGKVSASQVVGKILARQEREKERPILEKPSKRQGKGGILVRGTGDLLIKLARCCQPVPGDEIIGYITRGRGVTVHRVDCPNLQHVDSERKIDVSWDIQGTDGVHPAKISVITVDQKGMLASVSNAISSSEANIVKAEVTTTPDKKARFIFVVEVTGRDHLNQVLSNVRQVSGVLKAERRFS
ncbi:RelA/SpoT family protein [Thermosulfuriphilus sp.]